MSNLLFDGISMGAASPPSAAFLIAAFHTGFARQEGRGHSDQPLVRNSYHSRREQPLTYVLCRRGDTLQTASADTSGGLLRYWGDHSV